MRKIKIPEARPGGTVQTSVRKYQKYCSQQHYFTEGANSMFNQDGIRTSLAGKHRTFPSHLCNRYREFKAMMGAKIMPLLLGALIIAAISVVVQPSAEAIVINDLSGSGTAIGLGSLHPAVVEILIGGSFCSGSLIDSTHVITAQHCIFGVSAGAMSVNFHHLNNDGIADANISVSGKAEIDATNVLLDGTDIAILTLTSAAPAGIAPLSFLPLITSGDTAVTVGFGFNGLGSVGHGGTADGLLWAAENVIDSFGVPLFPGGVAGVGSNIFNTDFDNGTAAANTLSPGVLSSLVPLTNEGTTAPGDSGGPLLVNGYIVGVLSGGTTTTSQYGDISWWTGTTNQLSFIQNNAPGANVVPEPSTMFLFGSGLAALAAWRYRKSVKG